MKDQTGSSDEEEFDEKFDEEFDPNSLFTD
jgi:hypothetical protein